MYPFLNLKACSMSEQRNLIQHSALISRPKAFQNQHHLPLPVAFTKHVCYSCLSVVLAKVSAAQSNVSEETCISSSSSQVCTYAQICFGFFLWADSREKKRYLEAGNSCWETNERSCLSWHCCLEKYLCNCCLQRVLLVNLSAPSECFCVFYSTQF